MGQHLGHGSLQAHRRGGCQGQHQQAHVAEGAVGHQAADVGGGNGIEGAIHRAHGTGGGDPGRKGTPGLGQQAHTKAQQAIGPQLRHHTPQQHHHRRRCFRVADRLPAMQGHHRQLDAETEHQQGQHPALGRGRQGRGGQGLEAEAHGGVGAGGALTEPAEGQYAAQQAEARHRPIEQEAHGGPGTALAAPDRYQQGGGDQHQLKCQHEQQGVAGQESPHHPQVGGQHQGEIKARAALVCGGGQHRHGGNQAREQHQRQRQPIEAQIQTQPQPGHPFEGQGSGRLAPGQQAHQQLGQGGAGGQTAHQAGAARRQQGEQQAHQQRKQEQQQQGHGGGLRAERWTGAADQRRSARPPSAAPRAPR